MKYTGGLKMGAATAAPVFLVEPLKLHQAADLLEIMVCSM